MHRRHPVSNHPQLKNTLFLLRCAQPFVWVAAMVGLAIVLYGWSDSAWMLVGAGCLIGALSISMGLLFRYYSRCLHQFIFHIYHDPLTSLPNHRYFDHAATRLLQERQLARTPFALLVIDIDGFKHLRGLLGYDIGDAVLNVIAKRILQITRKEDVAAYFGADQFILLLTEEIYHDAIAQVAQRLLDVITNTIRVGGKELFMTASIGIAMYPHDGDTVTTLLKCANTAVNIASEHYGKHCYRYYAEEKQLADEQKLAMGMVLRKAISEQQLVIHYQPQINAASKQLVGAEALLRWQHPTLGLLPPAEFIGLAEELGLLTALEEWMLAAACAQQVAWCKAGLPPMKMAINFSAHQFSRADLIPTITRILTETKMNPAYLELELTESTVIQPIDLSSILQRLKNLGIKISIDDFGTGYSSLSYLTRFSCDFLKIDQSFVLNLPDSAQDAEIIKTIIAMARSLNIQIIAEGVETLEQLAFLLDQGCELIQGYYVSPPLPAEQFAHFIRTFETSTLGKVE